MPEKVSQIVGDSLRLMLRPLVRFAIRRAFKLQDFIEISKVVFLDIAQEELKRSGEAPSSSRLSVMTGVHRRDVARIHNSGQVKSHTLNIVAKIVGQWQSDRRFLTKDRKPRLLSCEGIDSDFSQLVRSVSGDINPYTVLFELERTNIVKRTERGLQLSANIFVSRGDLREALELLASDAEDLYFAVEENIELSGNGPNLHIKTEYDNVVVSKLPEIRKWIMKRGSEFQRDIRDYISQFDTDINPSLNSQPAGARVAVGCFSFCSPTHPNTQ